MSETPERPPDPTTSPAANANDKSARPAVKPPPLNPPGRDTTWFYWFIYYLTQAFCRVWFRVELIGAENIPKTGPVLIAPTHTSFVDPPMLGSLVGRPTYFLARDGVMRVPVIGPMIRALHTYPIRRGGSDREAIRACRRILEMGHSLVFFPEGTRSRTGGLGGVQGGFAMILDGLEGVPYVPIVMQDTYHVLRRGWIFPRPRKVRIHIGKPAMMPTRIEGEKGRDYYARCSAELEAHWRALGAK